MRLTRLAALVTAAALQDTLTQRMTQLLADFGSDEAHKLGAWFENTFRVKSPQTPKGQKALKDLGAKLAWWLKCTYLEPDKHRSQVALSWQAVQPQLDNLVHYFSDEGTKQVPKQIEARGIVYLNLIGFEAGKFKKYVTELGSLFASVSGWRRKALTGTLKVALAGPAEFRGTAGGVYKSEKDTLFVRATPQVLKRGVGYASPHYILIHELGHRYEHKEHLPADFDKPQWQTTPYSRKEGEAFAELFALGHFGITQAHTTWDLSIQKRFELLLGS